MNSLFVKILDERKNLSWKLVLENLDAFFAEDKKIFWDLLVIRYRAKKLYKRKKISTNTCMFLAKKSKPNLDP